MPDDLIRFRNDRWVKDAADRRSCIPGAPTAGCSTTMASPDDQLRCARIWVEDHCPPALTPLWQGEHYRHDRTRLAYLSADFHEHATAYLLAEVFEQHDRSRFDTIATSYGPDGENPMRTRLQAVFDGFIDVRTNSDVEVAALLREMEVDIAVDLKGFTDKSRTAILASRPAPVQVNYLGYPGTMGADYVDYIIAD
jgi:protein O-GlcNAc transferase